MNREQSVERARGMLTAMHIQLISTSAMLGMIIELTPSGPRRNMLADRNIELRMLIDKLVDMDKEQP